ncbi:hypothetical protein TVAG_361110 [Trichomonas vaginalis G3]|uniref:Uncharacterized protein n=1 Tax=Trichomonas vaginalis (strain ATCC PRA-98 / G3) TaxID=412133 RepID=A2FNE8_TRIV3|nr:WD40 repeat-like family [Trichomonas vaginalis G3]EAX93556.1 hypothetical protein TVAG_361110 [Trichomonas vaginalis G3]KAI5501473.1 WD40 repeat-like family [Trichomonas vaginalis G3]|eukprot:XP_001306486.1 hypothetical protein [Trichomonas vaginalis G3]
MDEGDLLNSAADYINKNATPLTKELKWGVAKKNQTDTSNKSFISLCEIQNNLCATTDGESIHIWDNLVQKTSIRLKSSVLIFVEKLNQLISFSDEIPYLHFIAVYPPFTTRMHPFEFTQKKISYMVYFEKSSVLLSAGDGIMLTRLKFPDNFKHSNPVPEILQFEKIIDLYPNDHFTNIHHPFVSKNREIFFVQQNFTLFIHQVSNGDVIHRINKIPSPFLMFVNYDDALDKIITANHDGLISEFKFNFKEEEINFDSLEIIMQHKYSIGTPIYVRIYDSYFMIVITKERRIYTISLKTHEILDTDIIIENPIDFIMRKNGIYVLCPMNIFEYRSNFFTTFVKAETGKITNLTRCKSIKNASRIMYLTNNSSLTMISPRSKAELYKVNIQRGMREIIDVKYPRDLFCDGEYLVSLRNSDDLYILFAQGPLLDINLDNASQFGTNKDAGAFILPSKFSPTTVLNIPPEIRFIYFVHIEKKGFPNSICAITKNGLVCLFTFTNLHFFQQFHLNLVAVYSVCFSGSTQKLIVCHQNGLSIVDPFLQVTVETVKSNIYTQMIFVDKNKIFCGTNNGFVELREYPSLRLLCSSMKYNAIHKRSEEILSVDYCAQRNIGMSFVKSGDIFIYDLNDLFPIAHIEFCFELTSCCFLNGHGILLISAFDTIFEISSNLLYSKKLVSRTLQYDDFDMRADPFEMSLMKSETSEVKSSRPYYQKTVSFDIISPDTFRDLEVDLFEFPKHFYFEKSDKNKLTSLSVYSKYDIDKIWKRKKVTEETIAIQEEKPEENKENEVQEKKIDKNQKKKKRKQIKLFNSDDDDEEIKPKSRRKPKNVHVRKSDKNIQNQNGFFVENANPDDKKFITIKTDIPKVSASSSMSKISKGESIFEKLNRQSAPPKHRQVYQKEEELPVKSQKVTQFKKATQKISKTKFLPKSEKSTFLPKNDNKNTIIVKPNTNVSLADIKDHILGPVESNTQNSENIKSENEEISGQLNNENVDNTNITQSPHEIRQKEENQISEISNFKVHPPALAVEVSTISPSLNIFVDAQKQTFSKSQTFNPRLSHKKKKKKKNVTFAPELKVTHISDVHNSGIKDYIYGEINDYDAEIFTKYVIDGFDTPFKGYRFPIDPSNTLDKPEENKTDVDRENFMKGKQGSLRNPIERKEVKSDNEIEEEKEVRRGNDFLFITTQKTDKAHHTSRIREPLDDTSRVRFSHFNKK